MKVCIAFMRGTVCVVVALLFLMGVGFGPSFVATPQALAAEVSPKTSDKAVAKTATNKAVDAKAAADKAAAEKAVVDKAAAEKAAADKAAADKVAAEKATIEKAAADKVAAEKAAADKVAAEKAAIEKAAADKIAADRAAAEKVVAEKAAAEKAAAEKVAAEKAAASVQEVWDILLQNRLAELLTINTEADALQKDLPKMGRQMNTAFTSIEQEYQQIIAIGRVSRGLPVELTVVEERLRRLQERLRDITAPLEGTLTALQNRLTEISLLEKGATGSTSDTPELRDFLNRLSLAQAKVNALQTRINKLLVPARTLAENGAKHQELVAKLIPGLWRNYYLVPSGKLYDASTWKNIDQGLAVLKETYSVRISAELPQSVGEWVSVFMRGLTVFVPLYLLVLLSRKMCGKYSSSFAGGWRRLSRHSLPYLCSGLACHFAAWGPYGEAYHILSLLGTLLMSLGQMALAWDLYTFENQEMQRHSPLWPLFAPLLVGLLLLLLNLPAAMLGGVWLILLLVALWQEHRTKLPNIPFPLVRNVLQMHVGVLWLAVLMTILGWGRLSILVCMSYAAFSVSLQQAVGFMRLSNVVSALLPQKGVRALICGLFLALAVPTVLVVSTLATGLWILAYPGGAYLLSQLAHMDFNVGDTTFNMLQVMFILSAFYVTRSIITVGRSFLRELPANGVFVDQSLMGPIQVAYTYALWGLFGLYALSALGFSLTSLAVVAGGLSVGIGFGLQNIINNFVSGLLVIFGQTLREGDIIEVGNLTGTVKKINVRSTIVETPDNASIFVPNAEFLSGRLTNWTRNGRMVRREVTVGVAYGSDVNKVIELLNQVAVAHPRVLKYPEPAVLFNNFGSSTLDFALRFWIADILYGLPVLTDIRVAIEKIFRENDVEIAFPQMDVHVKAHDIQGPVNTACTNARAAQGDKAAQVAQGDQTKHVAQGDQTAQGIQAVEAANHTDSAKYTAKPSDKEHVSGQGVAAMKEKKS